MSPCYWNKLVKETLYGITNTIFSMGLIDALSPTGIAIIMLIIPLVKKWWHVLLYIISNHVAYVLAAVAVYFGVDKILKTLHQDICANYPTQVAIVKLVLAVICIIGAALMLIYLIRKLIARKALSMSSMIKVPSASPLFLVLFSFGYTFSNVYSFYPLFGFIAALVAQQLPFGLVFMWLFVFCMFSSLPKVLVYVLLTYVKGRFVQKFLDVLTKIMTAVCFYAIPILLIVAAWWLIETGLPVLA